MNQWINNSNWWGTSCSDCRAAVRCCHLSVTSDLSHTHLTLSSPADSLVVSVWWLITDWSLIDHWSLPVCVCRCVSIFFVEFQAHFGADYAATAWVHSLVDCTTMLCGWYWLWPTNQLRPYPTADWLAVCVCVCVCAAPVGSLIGNRWSCRVAVMLGGLLSSCGLLLSSFSTRLEFLYLSMGVLTGQHTGPVLSSSLKL